MKIIAIDPGYATQGMVVSELRHPKVHVVDAFAWRQAKTTTPTEKSQKMVVATLERLQSYQHYVLVTEEWYGGNQATAYWRGWYDGHLSAALPKTLHRIPITPWAVKALLHPLGKAVSPNKKDSKLAFEIGMQQLAGVCTPESEPLLRNPPFVAEGSTKWAGATNHVLDAAALGVLGWGFLLALHDRLDELDLTPVQQKTVKKLVEAAR